jgi:REP-associated tyrosine transposase
MPNYRRPRITGASIFFTVALADRKSDLLVRQIDALRDAVARTRAERPFHIEAWVVLPDHLHCVWRLPGGDADFSVRWGAIKARFSMSCRRAGFTPPCAQRIGLESCWSAGKVKIIPNQ